MCKTASWFSKRPYLGIGWVKQFVGEIVPDRVQEPIHTQTELSNRDARIKERNPGIIIHVLSRLVVWRSHCYLVNTSVYLALNVCLLRLIISDSTCTIRVSESTIHGLGAGDQTSAKRSSLTEPAQRTRVRCFFFDAYHRYCIRRTHDHCWWNWQRREEWWRSDDGESDVESVATDEGDEFDFTVGIAAQEGLDAQKTARVFFEQLAVILEGARMLNRSDLSCAAGFVERLGRSSYAWLRMLSQTNPQLLYLQTSTPKHLATTTIETSVRSWDLHPRRLPNDTSHMGYTSLTSASSVSSAHRLDQAPDSIHKRELSVLHTMVPSSRSHYILVAGPQSSSVFSCTCFWSIDCFSF